MWRWATIGLCLFLGLTLQAGSCGTDCQEGTIYSSSTVSTKGRPCSNDCECNNQQWEGYCGNSGSCIAITRASCQSAKGTTRDCDIHSDLSPFVPCSKGKQTCREDGLLENFWGNCKCSNLTEVTQEPGQEPVNQNDAAGIEEPSPKVEEPSSRPEEPSSSVEEPSSGTEEAPSEGEEPPSERKVTPPEAQPTEPDTQPKEQEAPLCQSGESRPCYPSGKSGCKPDSKNGYKCQGKCKAGLESCEKGKWSGLCKGYILPATETCNDKDDDCDGTVDNGYPVGSSCEVGKGACKASGKLICDTSSTTVCNAKAGQPGQEVCDGQDNDCDGTVDESATDAQQPLKRSCYTGASSTQGKGECKNGHQLCQSGAWETACRGEQVPTQEICGDNKDNDCSGQIDNGCPCDYLGKTKGVCKGLKLDSSGACPKPTLYEATESKCDSQDNDCDGLIDENLTTCAQKCSSNSDCSAAYPNCQGGQCIRFCKLDTECDDTFFCKQGYCQLCPDGGKRSGKEVCDGKDNNCNGQVDDGATCSGGKLCLAGRCNCPSGQTDCSGTCFDTSTSSNHCGACGTACQDGAVCQKSACACLPKPVWQWAAQGHGVTIGLEPVVADGSGNFFVSGTFGQRTVTFGSITLTGAAKSQLFVAKLSKTGTWMWAKTIALSRHVEAYSSKVDTKGSLLLAGSFDSSINFPNTSYSYSTGRGSMFVTKLDSAGKVQWISQWKCTGSSSVNQLVLDSKDNLFVAGRFQGIISLGSNTFTYGGNNNDAFVAKLDSSGKLQWAKHLGSSGSDSVTGMVKDSKDNIYISGTFDKHIVIGTTTLTWSSGSQYPSYLAKLDTTGKYLWARLTPANQIVGMDPKGNLYVQGSFQTQTLTLGTFTLTKANSVFSYTAFLASLDSSGTNWLFAIQSPIVLQDATVGPQGNLFVMGHYNKTVTLGSTTLTTSGTKQTHLFVAKLNVQGKWIWARTMHPLPYPTRIRMFVDQQAHAYVGSIFNTALNLDGISLAPKKAGIIDMYVAKLSTGIRSYCSKKCVYPLTDRSNCGQCANVCSSQNKCTLGACRP